MYRSLFDIFKSKIVSICYDDKYNREYEKDNEILVNKYKKGNNIKTEIKTNIDNYYNYDNYDNIKTNIDNYDNIKREIKTNIDNYDNIKRGIKTNIIKSENYSNSDSEIYDIVSQEEVNEYSLN